MAKPPTKRRKTAKGARTEKGRMQLYDVRVIDMATGEVIDERTLDCSCWLFAHWWAGDIVSASGQSYPVQSIIEVNPR